jgi:hypothetical protein
MQACTQHSGTAINSKRSYVDAVQQSTRDNTSPQSQYCGAAPYNTHWAQNNDGSGRPRHASDIARMKQPRFFTFCRLNAHITHMPTSAALPATITPQTRACRHTGYNSTTHHNGTSPSWRVPHKTAHTYKPRTPHRTLPRSIQTRKPRTPARCPAQPQPLHTAQCNHHCTHTNARTSPQHSTQLRPPDTPPTENHTARHTRPPCHTHDSRVKLPSVDGMLPESWLLYKFNLLHDTRTVIASHHGTRRRSRPQPAARNALHQSDKIE